LNHGPLPSGRSGRSSSALGPLTSTRYDVAPSDSRRGSHLRSIGSGPDSSGKRRRRKACGRPQARQTQLLPNDPDSGPLSRASRSKGSNACQEFLPFLVSTASRSAGDLLHQRDRAQPLNARYPFIADPVQLARPERRHSGQRGRMYIDTILDASEVEASDLRCAWPRRWTRQDCNFNLTDPAPPLRSSLAPEGGDEMPPWVCSWTER
jgi:hypothetical protein